MGNNGLKSKSELLTRSVGNTDVFCNLSRYHSNIAIRINLLKTLGANSTEFFLFFQKYNNTNIGFGKGVTCNFYKKIIYSNDKYIMTTYDGLQYEFVYTELNRYYNLELGQVILKNPNNSFYLLDGFGNRYYYSGDSLYPTSLSFSQSPYSFSFTTSNSRLTEIKVYSGSRIVSTINITYSLINDIYFATTITCTKPNNTINITYESNKISSITSSITGQTDLLTNMSYLIHSTYITILNNIENKRLKIYYEYDDTLQAYLIDKIKESIYLNGDPYYSCIILFSYENEYVKIYDNYGNNEYLYYENENIGYIFDGKTIRKCIYDSYDNLTSIYSPVEVDKNLVYSYNYIKNGYFESTNPYDNWIIGGTNHSIVTDSSSTFSSILGSKYFKIRNDSGDCFLEQNIEKYGSELDNYTLIFWVREFDLGLFESNDFKIEIDYICTINNNDEVAYKYEKTFPHKEELANEWYPIVLDVSPKKNFDKISFKLYVLNPTLQLGLDGFLLINSKVLNEIDYFEFGKKEKMTQKEDITNYIHNYYDEYNNQDKLGMVIDSSGVVTKNTYDQNYYNIKEDKSLDKTIVRTYDNIEMNNVIKEEVLSNNKKLVKEYTYTTSKDFLETSKNYDDSISYYYTNEARGIVYNEIYPSSLAMLTSSDNLDRTNTREISGSNFIKELYYTYEDFNSLNEIIINNNYKYDFNYYHNRLTEIKVNNLVLEKISYSSTYPYGVYEITKGSSGDKVKFDYNTDGSINNVYYKRKGESTYSLKYHFGYLNKHLISSDNYNGISIYQKEYKYDSLGHLIKVYDPNNSNIYNEYSYDEDYLVLKKLNTLSNERLEALNNNNKEMLARKSDLRDSALFQTKELKKYYTFFNESNNPICLRLYSSMNKSQGVTKFILNYNSFNISESNDNKYISLTSSSAFLKYQIPTEYYYNSITAEKGSYGILFIPSNLNELKTIFSIYDNEGYSRIVIASNGSNDLLLALYDNNGDNKIVYNFNKKCQENKINYFGISYSMSTNHYKMMIKCVFNNEKYEFTVNDINQTLVFNHFSVGSYKDNVLTKSTFSLYSIFAMPLKGSKEVLKVSELIKEYHLLKDIYETSNTITNRSSMDTFTTNQVNNLVDFIPLTNSFISKNSRKPIHLNYRYDNECIRNKYFRYIDSISEYMLKIDGINLVYDLDLDYTYTIGMNVLFNNIYNYDYIYSINDGTNSISLLIKDSYLHIKNNNLINTNIQVITNTLYFISLGLDYIISSDSLLTNYYKVRIVVNNNSYETTINTNKINSKLLIIGSSGMNEDANNFMDGYINYLCYNNTYMSVASISLLQSELNPLKTESIIDSFNRLERVNITKDSLKITKNIEYKEVEESLGNYKDTLFIDSEEVKNQNNNTLLQRSYTYGTGYSYGNITEVKENNSIINSYFYNQKGFLTSSYYYTLGNFEEFTYDNNSNITEKITRLNSDGSIINDTVYLYDSVWPDRLVQVNDKKIAYDSDSIGCPKHYGYFTNDTFTSGITYSWRCSKLIGLNDSINNKTISYDYDEEGNRIEKVITDTTTNSSTYHNYYYEESRLLTETINFNQRLDFLYDESNNIIGFDYTNNSITNRYYLLKNILGDVIKIVDNNSNIVVEYLYSAYGSVLQITGTLASTIGLINPIRYRSYYYDNDTNMYYLKTRFYNPEWCRFISSDNINYLEYNNPLRVNLFSYCNNNPVMNLDPDGTFWKEAFDYINTFLGLINEPSTLIAVGAVASAIFKGNWQDVVDDFNNGCINPFNQSEDIVLKSKVLSFYKGSTVCRLNNRKEAFSIFGTIWLGTIGVNANDVKHEYGHSIQERFLRPFYYTRIAIPSFIYCVSNIGTEYDYYSMPWERTADWLGGASREKYKKGSLVWGVIENLFGPRIIPIYLLFGY